jgi:hypothetical protein
VPQSPQNRAVARIVAPHLLHVIPGSPEARGPPLSYVEWTEARELCKARMDRGGGGGRSGARSSAVLEAEAAGARLHDV